MDGVPDRRLPENQPESAGVAGGDVRWMRLALQEARSAGEQGEVPVGAVVVREAAVLSRAGNRRQRDQDPTAHAEMVALREAARALGSWHLDGATVYVTLEPCPMCAGALVLARVARLVYGAADPKAGAAGTLYDVVCDPRLNHRLAVERGVLREEAAELLRAFFRARRSGPCGSGSAEGCPSG